MYEPSCCSSATFLLEAKLEGVRIEGVSPDEKNTALKRMQDMRRSSNSAIAVRECWVLQAVLDHGYEGTG